MKITKGLLLRCEFTKERNTFDKRFLSIRFGYDDTDNIDGVWISGQWMPSVKLPDFERLQSLWFGLTGEELKPID